MNAERFFNRLLIPVDGSASSLKAARFGLRLAARDDSEVVAVHVIDEESVADLARYADRPADEILERMRQNGEGYLEQLREIARPGQGAEQGQRGLRKDSAHAVPRGARVVQQPGREGRDVFGPIAQRRKIDPGCGQTPIEVGPEAVRMHVFVEAGRRARHQAELCRDGLAVQEHFAVSHDSGQPNLHGGG